MKLIAITTEFSKAICENGDLYHADLKRLFDTHPSVDVFYITSDAQAFFAENMADSHGQKLKVRDYIEVTREQVFILDTIQKDEAPGDQPPADVPPSDQPPADVPPADQPPADVPPADQPPADVPSADQPPADVPSADQPPADVPPADQPPANVPPADQPPADVPPATVAPKDALAVAFATPEADRTPYQKGLITKATKATEGGNN
ncbi:hypothetical protein MTO98_26585 [Mucilaginibacter sp. SMC90]|uniref:hypothetical protein n=1 Tax=Mucilaginibacter sp. SMC90 TaxID=2929803 RepID=UPI001FB3955C|nr:hypothetical protein [Mucilaginibacter sp. SMC90]UOE47982.1 hypothetical protein MTO98_26585 [Mucilaginibacter sp. SMC90]